MTRIISVLPFLIIGCNETSTETEETPSNSVQSEEMETVEPAPVEPPETEEEGASNYLLEPMDSIESSASYTTRVVQGDTLLLISRYSGLSVDEIGEYNGIDVTATIYPGQTLELPFVEEAQVEAFRNARAIGTQDRLEDYLSSRGGLVDVDEYVVRTGESAWGIAQDQHGLPVWVLASFNEDVDLEFIGIGQRLSVPVLGDTLASLEEEEVDSIDMETIGLPVDDQ